MFVLTRIGIDCRYHMVLGDPSSAPSMVEVSDRTGSQTVTLILIVFFYSFFRPTTDVSRLGRCPHCRRVCGLVPWRVCIAISDVGRTLLLVLPAGQSEISNCVIFHHGVDLADWKLDNHAVCQLWFCLPDCSYRGALSSRLVSVLLAAAPDLLCHLSNHLLHCCVREQDLAHGRYHMCCIYRHQHPHHPHLSVG